MIWQEQSDIPFVHDIAEYSAHADDALVQLAKGGDRAAFDCLALRYKDQAFRTILKITRNQEDAEDQLQETLFRAYRGIGSFRGQSKFSSWLMRIAMNQAFQCLRRRRRERCTFDDFPGDECDARGYQVQETRPSPEKLCAIAELTAQIHRKVLKLPRNLRSVVILTHYRDQETQEAAAFLGISVAAIKSRMYRARRFLSGT